MKNWKLSPSRMLTTLAFAFLCLGFSVLAQKGGPPPKPLTEVAHNGTLAGQGTTDDPLMVSNQGIDNAQLKNGAVTADKIGTAASPTTGQVLSYDGGGLAWQSPTGAANLVAFRATSTAANLCVVPASGVPAPDDNFFIGFTVDHPDLNDNPNAMLVVTQVYAPGVSAALSAGVLYTGSGSASGGLGYPACPANRWFIFSFEPGKSFNVLVSK